ncbi:hypothetical protein [Novosphingopyxis sp.]|uniref:hypothetical protein n=1 Tax=Novosphingopyxis sp. TaxID=2709690 RepID=UPI003B599DE3
MTPLPARRRRWDFGAILLSMLALTGFFLLFQNNGFRALDFADPDDALRLVEVRDWMAGQSWFDVSQHRINPPFGGEMHWWRMLDIPIAAFIWLFGLFLKPPVAEHVALIMWPLLLYGIFLAVLARVLRRLGGDALCWLGLLMPVSMIFLIRQFSPLRIDHHGWQVVAATALLALSLGTRSSVKGLLAGLVMAFYLSISLEALPYFLLLGGLYAWAYWRDPAGWPMLRGFLIACAIGTMVSLPASRGWEALAITHCDGLSAPYWSALAAAAIAMLLGARLIGHGTAMRRLALLTVTGIAALAAFLWVAPQCSSGPFAALDPLVRQYWYLNVLEGLPLTAQDPVTILYSIIPTLMGLLGSVLAIRGAEQSWRANWRVLLVLQIGAAAVSIWVMRAMYVSHAFAVPGCAFLALTIWHRARRIDRVSLRVLASVAAVLAVPSIPLAIISRISDTEAADGGNGQGLRIDPCFRIENIARLNRIAPATLFAPIDLGPAILTDTSHSVIATGHHRNQAAMATVIGAFLGDEEKARQLVTSSHADLLMVCPGTEEMRVYVKAAPKGFAARLIKGDVPGWLAPIDPGTLGPYRVYKIRR